MIPAAQSTFDYSVLDASAAAIARSTAKSIRNLESVAKQSIVEIGQALIGVKEHLGHGNFLAWVAAEFDWTDQTARNFMNVAAAFKSKDVLNLTIDPSALYVLAAPSTPDPVRAEMIERAQSGERITHATAKAAVQAAKAPASSTVIEYAPVAPSPARVAQMNAQAQELAERLRPIEVPAGLVPLTPTERVEFLESCKSQSSGDAQSVALEIETLVDLLESARVTPADVVAGLRDMRVDEGAVTKAAEFLGQMREQMKHVA